MKQSLTKLVDVILRKIEESPDNPVSEKGLRNWLQDEGYPKRDIDAAMKLLRPRLMDVKSAPRETPMTTRAFSFLEELKLTAEARNALMRLEAYGLVDPYEREMILDRLNHFEGEVGLEEMDYLIAWVVCSNRDVESQNTIYSVMDGPPNILH
jgi:uncharacterized protein Smg (DUF494 family)